MDEFKKDIARIVSRTAQITESMLETPKDSEMGDFALPCFNLAKELKKSPEKIAKEIAEASAPTDYISRIEAVGPYVNFFVNPSKFAESVLVEISKLKNDYGKSLMGKEKTVMVEYSTPNPNKPQHVGHVRNDLLGMTISNILEFAGYKVIKSNLINDRGIHICKSMLAYRLFGENREPNKKTDHFVGDFYVLFNEKVKENPALENEAHDMLKKWEEGDKETLALWRKMNNWVYKGWNETYDNLGIKFDVNYYESNFYKKGKKIVEDALEKGIFEKNADGAVVAKLEQFGLPDKIVLRADGTSIYITQDFSLAKMKFDEYKPDQSIYVVGSEHVLYFQQLFKIFKLLQFDFADKCFTKIYGMVNVEGARLKSREGKTVDADDVIAEMTDLARNEVKKRYENLSEKEVDERSRAIGLAALKFFMLKQDAIKDINFIPKESLSFEGETGPYVQYAYARISSILEKYGKGAEKDADFRLIGSGCEKRLVSLIAKFPEVNENAAKNYDPSIIAHYLISVAQAFSEFYHSCPVLAENDDVKKARIFLISCARQVIKNGLALLGVDVLEEM